MALRDQPYLPLYIQDFLTDEKLIECSPLANGVYIRLMCIMHKSEEYGKILLRQKDKQNPQQLLNFAGKVAKQMPYDYKDVESGLKELIEEKVVCIEGDFLVQKRMVKDNSISLVRSKAGKKSQFVQANTSTKQTTKGSTNSENETVYETETINEDIILNEYKEWGEQIIDNNDHYFQTLMHNIGPKITPELFVHLVNDHFGLLNRYPKMRPKTQQSFRNSLIKHINENYKKNGTDKKQQHTASIINALKDEHSKLFGTGQ